MKRYLKLVLIGIFTTAICGTAIAQNNDERQLTREQLAEVQAKHIAKEMHMNDTTRTRFIKTYCDYQKEIWALGPRMKKLPTDSLNNQAAQQAIEERFEQSQKILNIRKKYYEEYSKFLTQEQIVRVYELERQIMNRLSDKKKKAPKK